MASVDRRTDSKVSANTNSSDLDMKTLEYENTGKDLGENKRFEIKPGCDCGDEAEPGCFSSMTEFRYRVWEFCIKWKYIICC